MKLADLTPQQIRDLAPRVPTSTDYLRHLANGRRKASAETAAKIESAAARMGLTVGRETLCEACRKCKFRKACAASV